MIATNGPARRAEARWMKRATTSLPVPDSPRSRAVVLVEATCVACLSASRHAVEPPTTNRVPWRGSVSSRSARSRASRREARAAAPLSSAAAAASLSGSASRSDVWLVMCR